jgi:hypothetical protein
LIVGVLLLRDRPAATMPVGQVQATPAGAAQGSAPAAQVVPASATSKAKTTFPPTWTPTVKSTSQPTKTPLPTNTPEPTNTPAPTPKPQTKKLGPINDTTRDESFSTQISVNEVRYSTGDDFSQPKKGYVFVIVDATIKNLGPDPMRSTGPYDFQLRDAGGALRDTTFVPETRDCQMDLVDLGANGSITGCFGFEAPDTGSLELIYAPYKYEGLEPGRYLSFKIR